MHEHIKDLLDFLDGSPSAAQASAEVRKRLEASGFQALYERDRWNLEPGDKRYIVRATSVIAFVVGSEPLTTAGYHIAASHIDSPGLKLKPESVRTENGVTRMAVEVYGGPILSTWTDRDLGIAGQVALKLDDGTTGLKTVDLKTTAAVIPNAAIHLNREVNKGFKYNPQTHLQAILSSTSTSADPLKEAVAAAIGIDPKLILDMELFLYDRAKAETGGLDNSLIFSGRLDNLGMSHAILSAILETD